MFYRILFHKQIRMQTVTQMLNQLETISPYNTPHRKCLTLLSNRDRIPAIHGL